MLTVNSIVGRPAIGSWYRHLDKGEVFQVVGFDDRSRTIEIQAFDGDIDEMDEDVWNTLSIAMAEPPEDATGPIDDVDRDDASNLDSEIRPVLWTKPLESRVLEERDEIRGEAESIDENGDRDSQ